MNSNQYLRPEDLPITDAKKSPLALLAQTCSNIGADLLGHQTKSLRLPGGSEKRKSASLVSDGDINCNKSRSDSASLDKTQPPSESTRSSSANSIGPSDSMPATSMTQPAISASNSSRISFKPYESSSSSTTTMAKNSSSNHHADRRPTQSESRSNTNHSDVHQEKERKPSGSPKQRQPSASPKSDSARSSTSSALTFTSNGLDGLADSKANHHQQKSVPSALNGYGSYHAALAEHEQLLKSSAHFAFMAHQNQLAAQLNASKPGPCSDPYCRGCQMALAGVPSNTPCHNLHPSLNPFNAASLGLSMSGLASRGYAPGLTGPPGAGGRPFTCSWTAGGAYCGKTFTTSEELLQHLKSHTAGFSPAALNGLGQYPHLDPMLTSPAARLRRTVFDPVSRYHPYTHKNFGPPSMNPLQSVLGQAGLAGLNPYAASLGLHYPNGAANYGPYASRIGPPIPP